MESKNEDVDRDISLNSTYYIHICLKVLHLRARKGTGSKFKHIELIHQVLDIDYDLCVPNIMLNDERVQIGI